MPLGEERKLWAEQALREKGGLAASYERQVLVDIIDAAKELLVLFSSPSDESNQ
jgi:hypothetical protein